eukprot:g3917.t1
MRAAAARGWSRSLRSSSDRIRRTFVHNSAKAGGEGGEGGEGGGASRYAIVGSGPAGFYTAKYLLKEIPEARVDMIEKLPTPFGLVRYGVAPDHQDVKNVTKDFESVANSERFRFFGNVELGADVGIQDLMSHYDGVVLATGASGDRSLGIEGEDLSGVTAARTFVNWYNGHPDYAHLDFDLSKVRTVVVFGQGNVAVDCARILTRNPEELEGTDISQRALDALRRSAVRRVIMIGRRSHVQAAFTMKETRELTRLEGVRFVVHPEELAMGRTEASLVEISSMRAKKRMDSLLQKAADASDNDDDDALEHSRTIELRFLASPRQFFGNVDGALHAVELEKCSLAGDVPFEQFAVSTSETEVVECDMAIKSIGYKVERISADIPFDEERNICPSEAGRVMDEDGSIIKGLYCAGWAKRGPSGIIGTNIPDARQTVAAIVEDHEDLEVRSEMLETQTHSLIEGLIDGPIVTWEGHQNIDTVERLDAAPALRRKILDREALLKAAQSS